LSCYAMWGNPNLQPTIGMAWDCGGEVLRGRHSGYCILGALIMAYSCVRATCIQHAPHLCYYQQKGILHCTHALPLLAACVTTGPVTVPILLALGIGVMRSQRQRKAAQACLSNAVAANAGGWWVLFLAVC
jgi:hypothetical protein